MRAVEIHGPAPGIHIRLSQIGGKSIHMTSFRTQVVVDDAEYNRHSAPVAYVDQPLEPLRPTIAVLYGEGVDAVVSPVTIPGKLRYRHQFNRGHSQRPESLEVSPHGRKGSLMGKSSDVKLVKVIIFVRRGIQD